MPLRNSFMAGAHQEREGAVVGDSGVLHTLD